MAKLEKFLLLIVTVISLSACSGDDLVTNPTYSGPTDKTIFMYLPWTASKSSTAGSLRSFFMDNIADIERGIVADGGLHNNRLVIFMVDSVTPTKEKAVMMEIKYKNGVCYRETIQTFTASDMPAYTTAQGLAGILNKVKSVAPANMYAMIIGCHGMGWLRAAEPSRARTRYFGGASLDYQMDTPVLAEAIKAAGMKMQYVMFDDCYMSTIEVAYDLREVTSYLMACTSEIMAYGMPYSQMWSSLAKKNPDYKAINETFLNFYSSYVSPYGAFGITDCSYVDEMARIMKNINAVYTFNSADIAYVQKLDGFRNTIFFDLDSYVKRLCGDQQLYVQFSTTLQKLVPYRSATSQIYTAYTELPSQYITVNTFSGITISDPTVSTRHSAVTSKTSTAWWNATH